MSAIIPILDISKSPLELGTPALCTQPTQMIPGIPALNEGGRSLNPVRVSVSFSTTPTRDKVIAQAERYGLLVDTSTISQMTGARALPLLSCSPDSTEEFDPSCETLIPYQPIETSSSVILAAEELLEELRLCSSKATSAGSSQSLSESPSSEEAFEDLDSEGEMMGSEHAVSRCLPIALQAPVKPKAWPGFSFMQSMPLVNEKPGKYHPEQPANHALSVKTNRSLSTGAIPDKKSHNLKSHSSAPKALPAQVDEEIFEMDL